MRANTSARHTVLSDDFLISIFRTPIIVTKKIRSCIIQPLVTVQLFSILCLLWSILNAPILSKNAHISTTHDPHNASDENLTSLRESRSRLEEDQFAPLVGLIQKIKLKFGRRTQRITSFVGRSDESSVRRVSSSVSQYRCLLRERLLSVLLSMPNVSQTTSSLSFSYRTPLQRVSRTCSRLDRKDVLMTWQCIVRRKSRSSSSSFESSQVVVGHPLSCHKGSVSQEKYTSSETSLKSCTVWSLPVRRSSKSIFLRAEVENGTWYWRKWCPFCQLEVPSSESVPGDRVNVSRSIFQKHFIIVELSSALNCPSDLEVQFSSSLTKTFTYYEQMLDSRSSLSDKKRTVSTERQSFSFEIQSVSKKVTNSDEISSCVNA